MVVLIVLASPAWSGSSRDRAAAVEDLRIVRQALLERQPGARTLYVRYRLVSKYWEEVFTEEERRDSARHGAPTGRWPVTNEGEVELAFHGAKVASYWRTPTVVPTGGKLNHAHPFISAHNGEKSVVFENNAVQGSSQPVYGVSANRSHGATAPDTPWTVAKEDHVFNDLESILREVEKPDAPPVHIEVERASDDGRPVWRLSVSCDSWGGGYFLRCTVVPELKYAVTRCEIGGPTRGISTSKASSIELVDGLPVPKHAEREERGPTGAMLRRKWTEVLHVSTRAADIPAGFFDVAIPPDAAVTNLDTGEVLRDPVQVERFLNSVEGRYYRDWRVWLAGVNVLLMALGGWLFWRRRSS